MATARDELREATGEEDFPTIREALTEIGRDPVKYGEILDQAGPDFVWEKVYKTQDPLEIGALTLLLSARQSGADPEEYLSRLAPYFDSEVQYSPVISNLYGVVKWEDPQRAIVTASSRQLGQLGTTLPHELEHTLQMTRPDDPAYSQVTRFSNSPVTGDLTRRFGTWDEKYDDLQENLQALPEEQRNEITGKHPVFGAYMGRGSELMARLRAREMLDAAKGQDFYQSEMGQALLPTDEMRAYMVGSTLPGVASATPPWSFERTDEAPTSVEDQSKSYARRILEMLPGYFEGGEVDRQSIAPYGLRWSDVTQGQPPVEAKGLGYFGKIPTASGAPMTELSTAFNIDGKIVQAPLVVPTLTPEEIQVLQSGSEIPESIYEKAYEHAIQRIQEGKDPFATGQDLRRGYANGGEVEPYKGDYVWPDRPRDYVSPSSPTTAADLQRLGAQVGLTGLGFAPGAGMADYLGYFPSAEGGMEPSAAQNWQQGNYGTAALQGLGAVGDLLYTVPILGATVGTLAKGPRTAQKMLKELPKVDEMGFYSQTEKAVMDIPQKKGTGQQFLAQLQKTPGVKPEELQYTGLDQFLANKPTVTKEEIQDYLDTNRVQLKEVTLGQYKNKPLNQLTDQELESFYRETMDIDVAEEYGSDWRQFRGDIEAELTNPELETQAPAGFAKFSQLTIPGGANYREVLLTMPTETPMPEKQFKTSFQLIDENGAPVAQGDAISAARWMEQNPNAAIREVQVETQESRLSAPENVFLSSHFDQPNILAHMRLNDRVVDGKPTLFVEEIQSDWHQAGREEGYRPRSGEERRATTAKKMEGYWEVRDQKGEFITNVIDKRQDEAGALEIANARLAEADPLNIADSKRVPDAPFKKSWHELTLKKALNEAATKGYDQIAFTTGKTQADRYSLRRSINSILVAPSPKQEGIKRISMQTPSGSDLSLAVGQDGIVTSGASFVGRHLDEVVGKEMAEKILKITEPQAFTGLDLEVGGEGMKGFYDNILPKSLNKIGKKYGTSVRKTTMDTPDGDVEVWAMDLTPEMRETITTQGQPLFQIGAGAAGLGTAGIMGLTSGEAEAAE